MLKKRILGVVTVKDGLAVQSIGYRRYLPLGRPEHLIENLDRWGADEILLQVIDRSKFGLGPDFELLGRVARLGLGTPLLYGGGIKSPDSGINAVQCGADRVVLDAMLLDDPEGVRNLARSLGSQAIVGALPVLMEQGEILYMNYRNGERSQMPKSILDLIHEGTISELLLIDCLNEGHEGCFDYKLIDTFPHKEIPLIVFGGISRSTQIKLLLQAKNVAAVAVGNFLNYREHSLQNLKKAIGTTSLRAPIYQSDYPFS